jgi:hypothetical protein
VVMGLAASLSQGIAASPSFCPISLGMREASASPRAKGNKKSAVIPHPNCLGQWPNALSVDSMQSRYKYQRPSVVYGLHRAEPDIRPSALDLVRYRTSGLRTLSRFFLSPLELLSEWYFHNVTS